MNKKANEGKIILQRQDLRHLQWTKIRHSSGTAGSFLKATARIQGERLYNVDPLADRPVQCFVGSHSATEEQLSLSEGRSVIVRPPLTHQNEMDLINNQSS